MNDTKSFAEVFDWFEGVEFVVLVATAVALLIYQVPAYRRWRTRALLLIVVAGILDLFITVFEKTFGQHGPPDPNDWVIYWCAREFAWVATVILGTVGALMFLRDYERLASATHHEVPPASSPNNDGGA